MMNCSQNLVVIALNKTNGLTLPETTISKDRQDSVAKIRYTYGKRAAYVIVAVTSSAEFDSRLSQAQE